MAQLPVIFEYFIPGFIFICVFQYFTSRKFGSYIVMGSVAISYLLKAICSWLHTIIFIDVSFGWNKRAIILCVLAFILSIICVVVSELKIINKISLKINNKSLHDDVWNDVIDYKNGTTLRLVCEDCTYQGVLVEHEEKGNDSWFVLKDYIVDEDNTIYKAKEMGFPCRIVVNLKDVKRVELYYGIKKKSKLRLWLEKNRFFKRFLKEQESD